MRNFVIGCIVLFTMAGTAFSETKEPPKKLAVDLGGGVKMEMVLIPAGEFKMGSGESAEDTAAFFNKTYGEDILKADLFKDEHPQHRVRITKPFYLGTYHVTRGQFRQFVADTGYKTDAEKGEKPGAFGWNPDKKEFGFNEKYSWRNAGFEQTDEHPVVNVSWNDAVAFCKWLSRRKARPTDCPRRPSGNTPAVPGRQPATTAATIPRRWPRSATWPTQRPRRNSRTGNTRSKPATATCSRLRWEQFKPNAFGLYDMHGNAWQWCADWYGAEYYAKSPADDPTGPDSGECPCPSWRFLVQLAVRHPFRRSRQDSPDYRYNGAGFRVARTQ